MDRIARWSAGLLLLGILFATGVALIHTGVYGFTIFLAYPAILGGLTCWVTRPKTRKAGRWYGAIATIVASTLLLLIGVEGIICLVWSLPLTLPLGIWGASAVYDHIADHRAPPSIVTIFLLLPPATLAYDTHAQPPIYAVRTSIEIAAPPDRVWNRIINLSQLPAPHEWYFHTGLAYPTQARIEGTGAGATRYCEFSTGPVVESIEIWDAPRLLRFRVIENAAPMREWSPYGDISPKHLHGYLISREGEFRLSPLPGNRTLLSGTSWYQHGLWPAEYWRFWSDAVVHRIHLRVFREIKRLAEGL